MKSWIWKTQPTWEKCTWHYIQVALVTPKPYLIILALLWLYIYSFKTILLALHRLFELIFITLWNMYNNLISTYLSKCYNKEYFIDEKLERNEQVTYPKM